MSDNQTIGVSESTLNKFKIKNTGKKYLPKQKTSAEDKIFSSLVKTAISAVSQDVFSSGSDSGDISFNSQQTRNLANNVFKSIAPTTSKTTALFNPSQSQMAADALKQINLGQKNL